MTCILFLLAGCILLCFLGVFFAPYRGEHGCHVPPNHEQLVLHVPEELEYAWDRGQVVHTTAQLSANLSRRGDPHLADGWVPDHDDFPGGTKSNKRDGCANISAM